MTAQPSGDAPLKVAPRFSAALALGGSRPSKRHLGGPCDTSYHKSCVCIYMYIYIYLCACMYIQILIYTYLCITIYLQLSRDPCSDHSYDFSLCRGCPKVLPFLTLASQVRKY